MWWSVLCLTCAGIYNAQMQYYISLFKIRRDLQYVLDLRVKLLTLSHLIQQNLHQVKEQQVPTVQLRFSAMAISREFAGDDVLILLPMLNYCVRLLKWQGPFEVTCSVRQVNHDVRQVNRGGLIYHLNLLKLWKGTLAAIVPKKEEVGPDVNLNGVPQFSSVLCGDHVSVSQKAQLARLQRQFPHVF